MTKQCRIENKEDCFVSTLKGHHSEFWLNNWPEEFTGKHTETLIN